MKFGEQLKSSLIKDYYYYYVAYDDLKNTLKKELGPTDQWTDQQEINFVGLLETELDKVYTFQRVKNSEINRRLKNSEKEVEQLMRLIESRQPFDDQHFEDLEEELSDIIADVHDLAKFSRLNYTAFQKIVKKHDKQTGWALKPIFAARLQAKPFYKDNYDQLVVKLSKLYDLVRTRGNPIKGDSAAGGAQQNFVRQTTKYWVHPDNITELKLIILKHLPVLVFNANKEFAAEDSAITSIYYDNPQMDLYKGRLEKNEGAEAIRLRWYGGMDSDQIFVERKTHREDWTGEKSVKARFALKEKHVNDFMKGTYSVEKAFEKAKREGKKSLQEIENQEALAREVQYAVLKKRLRPVMRSFYNRTAFQLPGDARVRISLDTELTMVREDNFDGLDRANKNWRRMDIGVDYPFNQLPPDDAERFPYAVLEVKLQTQMGQEPPQWVRDLISSHLVEAVPKFSKFIHGCSTLLPNQVDLIPFWLPQMNVDIKKPVIQDYGIEHPNNQSGSESGDYDDEERFGSGSGPVVRFDQQATNNINSNETTSLLGNTTASRNYEGNFITQIWGDVKYWFKSAFTDEAVGATVPDGTMFISDIPVPEGKRICVPVRVEPKVYFANERTFLAWIEISILLGAIAGGLLNFGGNLALQAAIGFYLTAVITICHSIALYLYRVVQIRNKRAVRYDNHFGPAIICTALAISTGLNFILHATNTSILDPELPH